MKIKVCGLKYEYNIEALVQLNPDYIGLIFYPKSKRYIGNQLQLSSYIRALKGIKKVGVFVNTNSEEIAEKTKLYNLDMVQLHGTETAAFCDKISRYIAVIKAFQIDDTFDFNILADFETTCSGFLFDTASKGHGGSGLSFDWQLLNKYKLSTGFFLSGGISLKSMEQIKLLNHSRLIGLDINSCFEISPGLKDITKIKTFIDEIRN